MSGQGSYCVATQLVHVLESHMKEANRIRWVYAGTILALSACVLVPFFLFGAKFESMIEQHLVDLNGTTIFLFVILFLAIDILLPIPSSIVSVWGGYSLGIIGGTLSVFIGMSLSCLIGYVIGKYGSRGFSERYIRDISTANEGVGVANMMFVRGVPVLAEATVVAMGIGRYPFRDFLIWTSLANLGIAILYALMGHLGRLVDNMFLVIGAGVVIPLLLFLLRYVKKLRP